jgi:hypothetical protein
MEPKIKVYIYAALSSRHFLCTENISFNIPYYFEYKTHIYTLWVRLIFEVMRNNTVSYRYVRPDVLTAGTPCSVS